MYADIIIDITHEKLDKIFQYHIPPKLEETLKTGSEVIVPFGKGNKETKGYVVGFSENADFEVSRIKDIIDLSPKSVGIEAKLVALAAWIKENYGGTMIQSLKTVLPIKQKEREKEKRVLKLLLCEEEARRQLDQYLSKSQHARARLLALLIDKKEIEYQQVSSKYKITMPVVRALEDKGLLEIKEERVFRNPIYRKYEEEKDIALSKEQLEAVDTFWKEYDSGVRNTYLIHGITGSGKTEVYIEMIRRVVLSGKQAIVLIPEIALTFQTVLRFRRIFDDRVTVMNSKLSNGERYDQMQRAKAGEIDVVIGPRSALFTPFERLGLIVIDEEHESTYKSEQIPRYHARETAIARAELEGAGVVLGSATPSLEAYYRCKKGNYKLLQLKSRVKQQGLPAVYRVDLRDELKKGNRSIFSEKLRNLMEERLKKKEQTLLFLNRRGYTSFLSCRACGYVVKCPHCDVSLSSHRNGKLLCHYCGYEQEAVSNCPSCGSRHISGFKAGTQQIEELVKKEFPYARVLRMDMDTTRQKDGHEKILEAFARKEADILVGTQMIVKGHDFPEVTLVGVIAADMSLYSDDYRSGERTFQLLVQVAGRAGRGEKKGEVVIQTYSPDHYSIVNAANQDYEAFYEEEMRYRELMGYPPAEHLLAVLLSGKDEMNLNTGAGYLKEYAVLMDKNRLLSVIGPASPYVGKVNDYYRKIIYLKSKEYDMLIKAKNRLEQYIEINPGFQKISIQFDFNPMNLF